MKHGPRSGPEGDREILRQGLGHLHRVLVFVAIEGFAVRIGPGHRSEFVAKEGEHLIDLVHAQSGFTALQFAQETQAHARAIRERYLRVPQALAVLPHESG